MKNIFIILSSFFLLSSMSYAEESISYVQSSNATLRAGPTFGSNVIAKVTKGQALTTISKDGNWLKVKVNGTVGYISTYLVSSQPPLEKQTLIKADDSQEIKPSARRRASSFTSAAAARGLTNDDKSQEGNEAAPDFKALDKMEAVKVSPDEVNKFKESGK